MGPIARALSVILNSNGADAGERHMVGRVAQGVLCCAH